MTTWAEMSRENLRAAKLLADQGYLRSSISRAYYAAYSAVAGELAARGLSFPHGWKNPSHDQLPQMIAANLALPFVLRRRINRSVRVLRGMREDADYRPTASISRSDVRDSLQEATRVLRSLGVEDD